MTSGLPVHSDGIERNAPCVALHCYFTFGAPQAQGVSKGRSPLASFSVLDGRAFRTSGLSRQEIRTHLPESRFYSSRRSTRWRGLTLILSADRVLRQHPFAVQLSGKAAPPIMRSSCSRASSRAGSEPTTLIGAPHNSERGSRQSLNLPLCTQISRGNARPV
jgi:hypothetical protein